MTFDFECPMIGSMAARLALDDTEDAAFLAEITTRRGFRALWPRLSLVDIGPLVGQRVSVSVRSMTSRKV
jgi:hypothetical protein